MASSNRHWPSMFKSKPCNNHHQWQQDINSSLMSNSCQKTPYASGCEERSPEPKPRWNPKPEQIRILEAIFNSGMVNPPREEIRKIRAQLQEYGQVGDANVFYWFQNRKSRSKHKQRHLQTAKTQSLTTSSPTVTAPTISSSSSSDKSSASADKAPVLALGGGGTPNFIEVVNSPTASVNQTYFQSHVDVGQEPFLFHVQAPPPPPPPHGCCFPELSSMLQLTEPAIAPRSGLLGELMNQEASRKEREKIKMEQQLQEQERSYANATTTMALSSTMNEIQGGAQSDGVAASSPARSTVFINNVEFEVGVGPLNVRELFGEEAVLLHSSGQPVLTNEWGVTLHSLQHGAFYYLV